MTEPIIKIRGASQKFKIPSKGQFRQKYVHALEDVDIDVFENQTLVIVGESGSGKSTLAKLLLLLREPTQGEVFYRGISHKNMNRQDMKLFRNDIQAVFQDPSSSLNPRMTIQQSLGHVARYNKLANKDKLTEFLSKQLEDVGLSPAREYLDRYPHQLSGGQQQRVAISRAMMMKPKVIIADEPLSSLDVSVQAQVLELMLALRAKTGVGFVIVSHDLGAMKAVADQVVVMYGGRVVEYGKDVFENPIHPYTKLLLASQLSMNPRNRRPIQKREELVKQSEVKKTTGAGCSFRNRCEIAQSICTDKTPKIERVDAEGTKVACHLIDVSVHDEKRGF